MERSGDGSWAQKVGIEASSKRVDDSSLQNHSQRCGDNSDSIIYEIVWRKMER
jgi:hypothetical protein